MKPKNSLTIVIPDLLPKVMAKYISLPPALKLLLSRSKASINPTQTQEQLLFYLFGYDYHAELPVAAVTGLIDNLDTHNDYWLRADPVELRADLSAVYLMGNQHLTIEKNTASQLNALLQQDNLQLLAPAENRWYIKTIQNPQITTHTLSKVIGKNIYLYMLEGENKNYWRKLFTEIQMLLHPPVTQTEGKVNALWLWGAGNLPKVKNNSWRYVFTDNILTQGLAKHANTNFSADNNALHFLNKIARGEYLMVLDIVELVLGHWFDELVKALKHGKIQQVKLYLGDEYCYELTSRTIWYFWRRNRALLNANI